MSTTPPTPDLRSYNRKLLDQIRALLAGKALDDVAMYKIGTRELTHIPLPELLQWEATVEARVRNERRRAKGLPRRGSLILFGSAERRGPRFAGFRLLLGRVLIALLSDPSDKTPQPEQRKKTPTAVSRLLADDHAQDGGIVLLDAGTQISMPEVPRHYYADIEDSQPSSSSDSEPSFDWSAFTSSDSSSSDASSYDSGAYSSDSSSSSDSSFSGGDGGDSGGAGAGGDW